MFVEKKLLSRSTQNELLFIDGIDSLFQTINNVESHENFAFIIDDVRIKCNRLFASFISPSIAKNIQIDRTMDSFTFHSEDFIEVIESYFKIILKESLDSYSTSQLNLSKKTITAKIQEKINEIIHETIQLKIKHYITSKKASIIEYLILLRIFKNLGNDKFVQELNSNLNKHLKSINRKESPIEEEEEIIERVQIKEKVGLDYSNEIDYIKNHFAEMNVDTLNEINQNIIETVISQKDFQIPDEDSFLYQILEMKKESRMSFLPYVQFPNLSSEAIKVFLKEVDFNEINKNLWNSISTRLLIPITEKIDPNRYSEPAKCEYVKCNGIDGIISFLNKKCGGNSHLKGIIEITSSGEKTNHCYDLIDSNFNSFFCTNAGYDSFIQFDFRDFKVSIEKYALKTVGISTQKFINWEICASNDLKNWDSLSRIHTNAWPGSSNISLVSTDVKEPNNFYRYIKILLKGPNAAGWFDMNLTAVEFFGSVKISKRYKFTQS